MELPRVYWITLEHKDFSLRLYPKRVQLCPTKTGRFRVSAGLQLCTPREFLTSGLSHEWLRSHGVSPEAAQEAIVIPDLIYRGVRSRADLDMIQLEAIHLTGQKDLQFVAVGDHGVVASLRPMTESAEERAQLDFGRRLQRF